MSIIRMKCLLLAISLLIISNGFGDINIDLKLAKIEEGIAKINHSETWGGPPALMIKDKGTRVSFDLQASKPIPSCKIVLKARTGSRSGHDNLKGHYDFYLNGKRIRMKLLEKVRSTKQKEFSVIIGLLESSIFSLKKGKNTLALKTNVGWLSIADIQLNTSEHDPFVSIGPTVKP